MQQSRYITTDGAYEVFNLGDTEKEEAANSLKYKGYIKIKAKIGTMGPVYSLTRKGVDYCNKFKKTLGSSKSNNVGAPNDQPNSIDKAAATEPIISENNRPCVFLSYAGPDQAIVEELYSFLNSHGFKPWMNTKDIPGGSEWEPAINRAIKNSDFFISCLTQNSVDRRGVMQKEISAAFDKKEEMLDDDIFLIPVRLEDCKVRDEKLRKFQRVDLFATDGHAKLLSSLNVGIERRKKKGAVGCPTSRNNKKDV
jgi:hypothetical protein